MKRLALIVLLMTMLAALGACHPRMMRTALGAAMITAAVVGTAHAVHYHEAHVHHRHCGHDYRWHRGRYVYQNEGQWEYYDHGSGRWYVYR
ncbi:MAG: hypothetical protein H6707_19330 [Deltaproteobacteria bacterium]|nr:hypothetical protein [Deltaproteobacteria bacterium]